MIVIAAVAIALTLHPGGAKGGIAIFTNVDVVRMFGHTTYHIDATEVGSNVTIESELEFPLDVFMAGINLGVSGEFEKGELWSVILRVRKNINDPGNVMKDSDWVGLRKHGYREKISFTESEAELDALILDINGRIGFLGSPKFTLEGILGYRYQNFTYEIFGVSGWQLDEEFERVYFSGYQGVNVLDYNVSYHQPYLGLATCIDISSTFTVDAEFAFSPITSAKDRDDHILRNKLLEGSCRGISYLAGLNAIWRFTRTKSKMNWSFGLGFELVKISTNGAQDQSWYGDDPVTEEDDTGLRLRGINERITNGYERVLLQIGCQF